MKATSHMNYLLLDPEGMLAIQRERLLDLERTHYRAQLQVAEMRALDVEPNAPGLIAALQDLHALEAAIGWHRWGLGVEPDSAPRVEPDEAPTTGDDEPVNIPVGEEGAT